MDNISKNIGFGVMAMLAIVALIILVSVDPEKRSVTDDVEDLTVEDEDVDVFESQEDLNAFIKYTAESGGYGRGYAMEGGIADFAMGETMVAPAAAPTSGAAKADAGASDYSTTNIQVEGVDEPDIIKNDGKYIYVLSGDTLVIVDAYPADDAEILSEIEFDESAYDLFINGDRLVVFTQDYDYDHKYYYGSGSEAVMYLYDISDRKDPELIDEITVDGNYFDSRMIGDYVYAIVNEPIYYRPCGGWYGYEIDLDCLARDIDVPEMTIDGESIDKAFPPIYYWDVPDYSYKFTTVIALNVENEEVSKKVFVMGASQDLYVSQDNIYVTRTRWLSNQEMMGQVYEEIVIPALPGELQEEIEDVEDSDSSIHVKRLEKMLIIKEYFANLDDDELDEFQELIDDKLRDLQEEFEKNRESTHISRIAIRKGKIVPKSTGSVPGTVLNQFSMDEYDDHFRIATTVGWNGYNNVYVLDMDLEIVGKLEELAPGESIYSARFMGKRCYLVTFRKIDPLFVIDLSDPEDPEVLGKLKIPGYSDYLHPYDENHLIGLGKETVEAKEGDFAWHQGVKLSLFDVSDVEKPKELAKYEIGDRGTDSNALYDHKAFLFSKDKNLLVIPILLAEIDEEKYPGGVSDSAYGDYVFQGAYVFDVTLYDGFELRGKVSHADADSFLKSGYYYSSPYSVKRSLYMDDVLYTVSDKQIKMNDLDDMDFINEIELPYEEERYDDWYWEEPRIVF